MTIQRPLFICEPEQNWTETTTMDWWNNELGSESKTNMNQTETWS